MTSDLLTQLQEYGRQLDSEAPPLPSTPLAAPLFSPRRRLLQRPRAVAGLAAIATLVLIGAATLLLRGGTVEPAEPTRTVPETWTTWTSATDNIVSECACQMAMATDGTFWLVGRDGISRYDGSQWGRVELPRPFTGDGWPAVASAPDGSVWVLGMSYVARWEDGTWDPVVEAGFQDDGGPLGFEGLWIDDDGLAWTGLGDEPGVILDGVFTPLAPPEEPDPSYPDAPLGVLARAPDGTIWMGMGDALSGVEGALVADDGERMTRYALGGVETAVFEEDGTGWFLVPEVGADAYIYGRAQWSDPGLYRLEGDTWYRITIEDGLAGYRFTEMIVAPDGAMWLSTADGTVTRYQPGTDPQAGTEIDIESRPFTDAEIPPADEYPPTTQPGR